jgi:hypothetical protein
LGSVKIINNQKTTKKQPKKMAVNGNKDAKGKGFKKGVSGNPNGRPRKTLSVISQELEGIGVTKTSNAEIQEVLLRMMNLTIPEVQDIAKDEAQSIFMRTIARHILNSTKGFDILEKILNRAIGTPTQQLQHVGKDGGAISIETSIVSNLSDETILAWIEEANRNKSKSD